ncbi:exostosin domain-containing protein [Flavobacterium sp. UBA6135]|uniref:exostosin domain-containing protein n=1 Tax=Flavobacterium sp. UBA6135 TaxID=1946553 RepID=UPI0025BB3711|nr:exostosin family protein [Flavobacterium sp. UBA6135]
MIKIFIPSIDFVGINKFQLFVLTRPFCTPEGWCNDLKLKERWGVADTFHYTDSPDEAAFMLLPLPVNYYVNTGQLQQLSSYNRICQKHGIKGFGYISGDFGKAYPEFSQFTYFRMGGFKRQLSDKNFGFPISLSDHFQKIYGLEEPIPKDKSDIPSIGFCGHATGSTIKRGKELLKCLLENGKRLLENPFRNDWEPLFASAYERWHLLQTLANATDLNCNFIFRKHYRGGAKNTAEQERTTKEYYDNILQSDYVLCVRGAGNFSVRLYETLLMGKIPIFVNTDCLLPLADEVDWKQHMVWVEWEERHLIVDKVLEFHKTISNEDFLELQRKNRKLWKEILTVAHYMKKTGNAL